MKRKSVIQFSKFCVVGVLNTAIDFGVLNLLMYFFGIFKGPEIVIFNIAAFTFASINSYAFNKFWTFKDKAVEVKKTSKQFFQYMAVSIVGITINTAIVYFITTIPPLFELSPALWANVAKLAATAISLMWNFIGYKFFVFKK